MPRPERPRFDPREIDPEAADRALALARDAGVSLDVPLVRDVISRTGAAAPAVLPTLFAAPDLLSALADEIAARGAIAPATLPPAASIPGEEPEDTKVRLRRMRNEAFARTALRELYAHGDVDQTAREWSDVASKCAAHATAQALERQSARDGLAHDERGESVPFAVLGMGKLGGGELNLGSDIDICFFYGTDDGAAGERTLNEHFGRVGALIADLLEDVTAQGFAFRVDLRLRPEGSRGPMANSLASAERYYETWGRSWERAALLRARAVAGDLPFGASLLTALRPFVYRRSVDPAIARDVSRMLDRARAELLQDDARDLKLGRGGIREAEFFVQSLQLVWGGRHPSLQVTHTLDAAARLRALGLLSHRESRAFGDAWALLRRVEHRVQVMAAYQTHLVPEEPGRLLVLARSLGYTSSDEFLDALARARATVRQLFSTLLPHERESDGRAPSVPPDAPESVLADLVAAGAARDAVALAAREALGVRDPDAAVDHLQRLGRRADMPLGTVGRERNGSLGPRLLAEVRDAPDPDRALSYLADLFGRLHGAERYARELADAPAKARGLVGLFGASETLSKTLLARPELLDAVVSGGTGAPSPEEIQQLVATAVRDARIANPGEEPVEIGAGALRRVQREVVLQIGLADMAGVLSEEQVAQRLSALAQSVLSEAFALAAEETVERFGPRAGTDGPMGCVAVFAMGSLAAGELGYAGDIDLIVLYDGDSETTGGRRAPVSSAEYVARLTQRAMWLLSSPHAEGPGYAVDTRLRPSGAQGTLVVSLESFARYHRRDPTSPGAAAWERQALIRSRFAAGDATFGARASAAIESVAYTQGAPSATEIARLRERMAQELGAEARGAVELKYGRGGLVDVEFAAQALQMAHGRDPAVRTPTTRRALRALRDAGHLDPLDAEALGSGETLLRRTLLAARLVTERATLAPGLAATTTVARKLGYRDRAERTAEESLLSDLSATRDRVRAAFDRVILALALP